MPREEGEIPHPGLSPRNRQIRKSPPQENGPPAEAGGPRLRLSPYPAAHLGVSRVGRERAFGNEVIVALDLQAERSAHGLQLGEPDVPEFRSEEAEHFKARDKGVDGVTVEEA